MKKILIITGGTVNNTVLSSVYKAFDDIYVIAVDGGAKYALNNKIPIDIVIGDFDTLSKENFNILQKKNIEIIKYKAEKDFTDTHSALEYCSDKYKGASVIVVGGAGSRLDHSLANLMVAFNYCENIGITFIDETNEIKIKKGKTRITKESFFDIREYRYLSVLPVSNTIIKETDGLKYNLKNKELLPYDSLGISNEIINGNYYLDILNGLYIIIKSID